MREADLGYPTSGVDVSSLSVALKSPRRGILETQVSEPSESRVVANAARPVDTTARGDGDVVSTVQVITSISQDKRAKNRYKLDNPHGGALLNAKHGASGIAGVRADIISGKLTVRQLSMMSLRQIEKRYRCCHGSAWRIKHYVCENGVDGRFRKLTGERKPLPPRDGAN